MKHNRTLWDCDISSSKFSEVFCSEMMIWVCTTDPFIGLLLWILQIYLIFHFILTNFIIFSLENNLKTLILTQKPNLSSKFHKIHIKCVNTKTFLNIHRNENEFPESPSYHSYMLSDTNKIQRSFFVIQRYLFDILIEMYETHKKNVIKSGVKSNKLLYEFPKCLWLIGKLFIRISCDMRFFFLWKCCFVFNYSFFFI